MKVLIVDDEAEQREYLAETVSNWGYEVRQAVHGEEALEVLESFPAAILLTDLFMPRVDGFELLRRLRAEGRSVPSILMTAFGSLEKAIRTIHELGGFWFLEKPIETGALKLLIERASAQGRLTAENEELRRQLAFRGVLGEMAGESRNMQQVFAMIRQVAPTSAAVLITGESGTGKELVARAIHSNSKRSTGPFVAINCAAMPEALMESEIFGHEKGSFTGAVERRIGALEGAEGGTLFLDELSEMPVAMQAKLLRVLEDFRYRRVGGRQELKADVRILAATNREPAEAIREGRLRSDLYYRLNVFNIHLPPLRERQEDIPVIVEHLIPALNRKHGTVVSGASSAFLGILGDQPWEGNIRELRNVLERAVILAGRGFLSEEHMPVDSSPMSQGARRMSGVAASAGLGIRIGMSVNDAERLLIEATLRHTGNNKTRAAAILGIATKTLHVKLREYADGKPQTARLLDLARDAPKEPVISN